MKLNILEFGKRKEFNRHKGRPEPGEREWYLRTQKKFLLKNDLISFVIKERLKRVNFYYRFNFKFFKV